MIILGISAFYHDSAACLILDGEILAAAQEERFSRKKHDSDFPSQAVQYCLEKGSLNPAEIDYIVFYEKPFLKFERLLETYLAFAPKGYRNFASSLPVWLEEKLFQKKILADSLKGLWGGREDWSKRILFSEHHLSHAASAFFPSPFEEAAVLTMDGAGEWTTTSWAVGRGNQLSIQKEIPFPHSLGLLYSAFTYYTGFKVNSGEYKVMGLAPYGQPKYEKIIKDNLIDIKEDGSFALNMSYFNYCAGLTMTNKRFDGLFGAPPRKPEGSLSQREMDLAASIQSVTEEIILKLTRNIFKSTGLSHLCLAGGVALNCVANGKVLKEGPFEKIWVQPAAGDAGGAIGAALSVYYLMLNNPRTVKTGDSMKGSFLGPEFSQSEIEAQLTGAGAVFTTVSDNDLIDLTAAALAKGAAVGWHQGRMEFGPRSLGNRSILADARSPDVQKRLNLKIKYRESFRPFAPSVLREDVANWFELETDSPYMLFVAGVAPSRIIPLTGAQESLKGFEKLNVPRSEIPAVTHVDNSARIQTVHQQTNPRFHQLIAKFKEITGCGVLVNTSFNIRGEPIVCTPLDAFKCFMGTEIELLIVGNCVLEKEKQNKQSKRDYKTTYELD